MTWASLLFYGCLQIAYLPSARLQIYQPRAAAAPQKPTFLTIMLRYGVNNSCT
jgi:hypothetical protein